MLSVNDRVPRHSVVSRRVACRAIPLGKATKALRADCRRVAMGTIGWRKVLSWGNVGGHGHCSYIKVRDMATPNGIRSTSRQDQIWGSFSEKRVSGLAGTAGVQSNSAHVYACCSIALSAVGLSKWRAEMGHMYLRTYDYSSFSLRSSMLLHVKRSSSHTTPRAGCDGW